MLRVGPVELEIMEQNYPGIKDHIRLFERSKFRDGFSYKHKRWQVATSTCANSEALATITIATSFGEATEISESLVVRRDDVSLWQPDQPLL